MKKKVLFVGIIGINFIFLSLTFSYGENSLDILKRVEEHSKKMIEIITPSIKLPDTYIATVELPFVFGEYVSYNPTLPVKKYWDREKGYILWSDPINESLEEDKKDADTFYFSQYLNLMEGSVFFGETPIGIKKDDLLYKELKENFPCMPIPFRVIDEEYEFLKKYSKITVGEEIISIKNKEYFTWRLDFIPDKGNVNKVTFFIDKKDNVIRKIVKEMIKKVIDGPKDEQTIIIEYEKYDDILLPVFLSPDLAIRYKKADNYWLANEIIDNNGTTTFDYEKYEENWLLTKIMRKDTSKTFVVTTNYGKYDGYYLPSERKIDLDEDEKIHIKYTDYKFNISPPKKIVERVQNGQDISCKEIKSEDATQSYSLSISSECGAKNIVLYLPFPHYKGSFQKEMLDRLEKDLSRNMEPNKKREGASPKWIFPNTKIDLKDTEYGKMLAVYIDELAKEKNISMIPILSCWSNIMMLKNEKDAFSLTYEQQLKNVEERMWAKNRFYKEKKLNMPIYVQFEGKDLKISLIFGEIYNEKDESFGYLLGKHYFFEEEADEWMKESEMKCKFNESKSGWQWIPVVKIALTDSSM
ncbi:MAG: hypothetical protein ABH886_01550 [Candidatus Desantisbacteria bacterium]